MLHLQKRYLHLLLFLLLPFLCYAQELNYVHYDTKDGLAGSTVYDVVQDKEGFIWFGTENGLSRFDGTEFKNYTVKDGLPDNEVLQLYPDKKGRIWILSFNSNVAYYYKGKIYNKSNDTLLRKLAFNSNCDMIAENEKGQLTLADRERIYLIDTNNTVKILIESLPVNRTGSRFLTARNDFFGRGFNIKIGDSVFIYGDNKLRYIGDYQLNYDRNTVVTHADSSDSQQRMRTIPYGLISYQSTSTGKTSFVNTYNGVLQLDTTRNGETIAHFVPGKKVSRTIVDSEKSFWFTTLGEGVYKLSSSEVKTFTFKTQNGLDNSQAYSLALHNNKLYCGLSFSEVALIDGTKQHSKLSLTEYSQFGTNRQVTNRLYCIRQVSDQVLLLGFDSYLVKLENGVSTVNYIAPIKAIDRIDNHYALVGSSFFSFKVRVSDLAVVDTIWNTRSTALLFHNNKYYVGTLNGLYEVDAGKTTRFLGDKHELLSRRISDIIAGADGTLYIATSDNGIVVYKNGKVAGTINEEDQLSSNICRTLYRDKNFLWAGTNKGLNKIDISKPGYPIIKFSVADGLPSDIINAIYVQDSIIWVGSPAGLSYFNESKVARLSMCNLVLTDLTVAGVSKQPEEIRYLPFNTRNINFDFAGISFKSGNDIVYYYKLDGLDKDWKETRQSNLAYQSLPSGDYELQLYAVNKFGQKSNTISTKFSIQTPFWKEWWFYAIVFLAAVSLTAWLVNRRSRKILEVREEKSRVQQQFAALEQQSLQAQMNPHFIFNCLNSIQQYILTNDKEKANQYLTGFASLVRQTLDNSSKRTITVAEEVEYLTKYLDMEEMRFGDNFIYEIVVDSSVNPETMEIPALLLQPYVENCLRHGIRYKLHGTGKVHISFKAIDHVLYCRIRDNGIGRQKAAELKGRQHIEYQSRGMKLTEKRIELLNQINNNRVTADIIDLIDEDGNAAGTEVVVKMPLDDHA